MNLSVIICCYNSAKTIGAVIEGLCKQIVTESGAVEVILVDNNCSDSTVDIARQIWNDYLGPMSFEVVKELRPGLNFARVAGINAASGDILVFCDDDNVFFPDYLVNVMTLFTQISDLGCVGPGIIVAVSEDRMRLSPVLRQFFQDKHVDGSFNFGGPKYNWRNMPAGTGMAIRKDVGLYFANKVMAGDFKCTDRMGSSLASGGDTQIVYSALRMGLSICLSDTLRLEHIIIRRKLSNTYIKKMYFGVNSCHSAHIEAWPELENSFLSKKFNPTWFIFAAHLWKYKHRSFRIGKLKHLISSLADKYGILTLRNEKDWLLDAMIYVLRLK